MKLYLYFNRKCISSEDTFNSDDYSGSYHYVYSNSLEKYSLSKIESLLDLNQEIIEIPFEFNKDEPLYLLWAEYSSGNSFGSSINEFIDVIGIYKTYKKVKRRKKLLYNFTEKMGNSVQLITELGSKYHYHIPWFGYFESLGYINISTISF